MASGLISNRYGAGSGVGSEDEKTFMDEEKERPRYHLPSAELRSYL